MKTTLFIEEMPETCDFCEFNDYSEGGVCTLHYGVCPVGERASFCPLKPLSQVKSNLATNKDILTSVIETCKQFHTNCESCPYWLKNKFNCIWNAHKIIGNDVMAYWDDEIEERII